MDEKTIWEHIGNETLVGMEFTKSPNGYIETIELYFLGENKLVVAVEGEYYDQQYIEATVRSTNKEIQFGVQG